jgi:nicotinamide-nucleotide amidase
MNQQATEKVYASIITIGDELLIGQVVDTNSAWIAQELNKIGVLVKRRVSVGDVHADIVQALDAERKESKIILLTGGLGPTADDITKPLLCNYFGGKMIVHEPTLAHVKNIFENILKRPLIERNLKQAEVPDVCTVVMNERGTAPGMWFEKEDCVFMSMPGVPHEMKGMMTNEVLPKIAKQFTLPHIIHKTLLVAGIGESFLAEQIKNWEEVLPAEIKLAYLPNYGMVRLRLSAIGFDKDALQKTVDEEFTKLKLLVKDNLVVDDDVPMDKVVLNLLLDKKKTVATAESCTGGYVAHLLTSNAGSSAIFNGSVVAYDYPAKENLLGVSHATLSKDGAVSESTVTQMVTGALAALKTDYAVATSGIMGPGGGMTEKPVGTVWIAVGNNDKTVAKKFHFRFDRKRNIELTANAALNMLREFVIGS